MADTQTIPAPPSGTIVDADPMAQSQPQQATSGQIPPPPSGSIVDSDPTQATRPELAPPPIARPTVPMSNSILGTIYSRLTHGPDGAVVNPKLAGARDFAERMEQEANNPSPMTQIGTGALASGLQTVHSAARIANAVTGDNVSGLPTTFKEPEQLETHGFYEGAGSVAEQLAEFAMGEGEAKAGAKVLAEHYGQVAKLAKVIEETPLLQKALRIARTSAISAAQSGAHGQDVAQGAEYGAAGGAIGEGLGSLGQWVKGKTPEALAEAAKADFESKQAAEELKRALQQTEARDQFSETVTGAYDRLGSKYGKPIGDSIARRLDQDILSYGDLAADLKKQAQPVFQQLDKETNGAFQATTNKIKAAKQIIRNPSSMEALEKAQTALEEGKAQMATIFDNSASVEPKDLSDARSMWKTMNTLGDLHDSLDKATSVPQKAHSLLPAESANKLTIDPKKFTTRLNNAVRAIPKNDLIDAIGEDGVKNLYTINQKLADTLADESRTTALNRILRDAARNAPKGSPLSTIGYGLLSGAGGAVTGAGVGATNAALKGQDVTSGAAEGAVYGAGAGLLTGSAIHLLYSHPTWGSRVLDLAAKTAPLGSQAVKSATHSFNPDTGQVEPIQNNND